MENNNKDKFYYQDWFLILSLIVFAPLGIVLLWKSKKFSAPTRVAITFLFGIMFFLPFGLIKNSGMYNYGARQDNLTRLGWETQSGFNLRQWFANWRPRTQVPATPRPVQTTPAPVLTTPRPVQTTPKPAVNPTASPQSARENPNQVPENLPAGSSWQALQDDIFELTNQERTKNGVPIFLRNQQVEKYAVAKSKDMADNNYFSHQSPTQGYFYDIWKRDNFQYSSGAENIYYTTGYANRDTRSLAQSIVTGWMNSEGHRKNILNPNLKELGVGVADKDGRLYATQLFYTR